MKPLRLKMTAASLSEQRPIIAFAGTPEFAATSLQALIDHDFRPALVLTQPDRPAGRGRQLKASPVKEVALHCQIEVDQPDTLKTEASRQRLALLQPDLLIVVAYGLILPPEVLALPRLGCINVHASLLPRWRGAAPIQRAILAGDTESGISIMHMDAGLDTGPVIHQTSLDISPWMTGGELHDALAVLGNRTLVESLNTIVAGTSQPQPQNEDEATYAAKLSKQEARLDWSRPAADLQRSVRAFNPWPVAHTELQGKPLRVWQAQAINQTHAQAAGTILGCYNKGILVACVEGALLLERVQLAGKKAMSATDFAHARALDGVVLGQA